MKEKLENIQTQLLSKIEGQMSCLDQVNTEELAKAIDAVHHLEEAMYYCSITKAMEKSAEEKEQGNMNVNYYMEQPMYYGGQPHDSMGRYMPDGRRNYDGGQSGSNSGSSSNGGGSRYYVPYMEYAPYMMRSDKWRDDYFGDKSGMSRRMYMEGKQYHGDEQQSMKELEHYIKDLGEDLTDMIKESSQEEKQVLSTKLQQLATKINSNK